MCMGVRMAVASLLACGVLAADAHSADSPLVGTWEMTSMKSVTSDGTTYSLPGNVSGSQLKTYSKGHFLFVGRFKAGEEALDNYGGGTFALDGDDYQETLLYHVTHEAVGQTLHFKLVIEGDTMTLTGPVDPKEQTSLGGQLIEVYRRRD
jgi:hypothetical protein